MKNRIYFLGIAGFAAAALAVGVAWKAWTRPTPAADPLASSRPNIILISLDTTRADHLGCYGYGRPTSPNLDRLAAGGVRFANARSQAPWTLPSHMSLFTSLLPSHHQVFHMTGVLAPEIPTFVEVLRNNGYNTAGFVNDGQMKALWGFNRGFNSWHEFPVGSAAGNCTQLTDQALRWLENAPQDPFLLFLHYYDVHDPYDAPEEIRERFGSFLSGQDCSAITRRLRFPSMPVADQDQFHQLIGSYDAGIAWLDGEVGRLLQRVPENTLVVVFSDHGEGFKEHGWTLHGERLYEEDIHVALLMHLPGKLPASKVVDEPVMLIDVAPTFLNLCGIAAPEICEGRDLAPTWSGGRFPERVVLSEALTSFLPNSVGTAVRMVALGDWKLLRSIFDGAEQLYHLPDEQSDVAAAEPKIRQTLSNLARRWIGEEDFWMAYAHGPGEFTVSLVPETATITRAVIPYGPGVESRRGDVCDHDPQCRFLRWTCTPGGETRALFFQVNPAEAAVRLDLHVDGKSRPDMVFRGMKGAHAPKLPVDLVLQEDASDPVVDRAFRADRPGFYIFHHRGRGGARFRSAGTTLNEETLRQLRSLGYLR